MPRNHRLASLTRAASFSRLAMPCNALCNALRSLFRPRVSVLALANAAEPAENFLGNAAEIAIEADGWVLMPFGDFEHSGRDGRALANAAEKPKGVIQRFDRAAAEAIVSDFKSGWSRLKRAVVGLPIFKGHPDAPAFAKRFPDRTPHGTIADMEVRERGLALRPVLTADGAQLVSGDGWSAFSPYWPSRPVGEENGKRVFSPFRLISIGLLPPGRENISGLSLANAAEDATENQNSAMNEKLRKFLASIGLSGVTAPAKAADAAADETALANALDTAEAAIVSLKKDKDTLAGEKTALAGQLATATAAKDTAVALANAKDGELTTAKTQLADERKARAKLVITSAVKSGRIAAASLDAETLALANAADFDTAAAAIEARRPTLPTQSRLGALGQTGRTDQDRTQSVLALVNAKMDEAAFKTLPQAERYDRAFVAVKDDPKNAALFAAQG